MEKFLSNYLTLLKTLKLREALQHSVGLQSTQNMNIGSLISLCIHFLRKHASVVQLQPDFKIISVQEMKALMEKAVNSNPNSLSENPFSILSSLF